MFQLAEELLNKARTVYIASVDESGYPRMRAMLAPRKREGQRVFYMTTNTSSQKVAQYEANAKASMYVCDEAGFRAVTFIGTVEVLRDRASRELIWQEGDTMYYPGGIDDPDYSVLRFTTNAGRYYQNISVGDFEIE